MRGRAGAILLLVAGSAFADWTELPLRPGARIIYVTSLSGDDRNDGFSTANAKKTVSAGFAAVRDGMGDHLYLRRGDTFAESSLLQWNKSGFSSTYPAVLGAYSTGSRPIIDRGNELGMIISSLSGPTVRHVAVVGIHFLAAQRNWAAPGFTPPSGGSAGIQVAAGGTPPPVIVEDLLIEDCRFEFLGQGVAIVGPASSTFDSIRNVRINRNVFVDIYYRNGHTNAVFASNVTGLVITDNVIDGVQRTAIAAGVPNVDDSSLSHSFYIQSDSRDIVIRNNIVANSFDGGMMRPGGTYSGNVVTNVAIGSHQGYMFSASAPIITEGVISSVSGNAFLRTSLYGIQMGNIRSALVRDNAILSGTTTGGLAFNLIGRINDTVPPQAGLRDVTLRGNFILGMEGLSSGGPVISNVTIENNQFRAPGRIINHDDYETADFRYASNSYRSEGAANQWFRVGNTNYDLSGWTTFIGEPRAATASSMNPVTAPDVASYHRSIGGTGGQAEFLAVARRQSRQSWDDRYTAAPVIQYLRQQLGLPPLATRRRVVVHD